jgi:hypothetical protein
MVRSKFNFDVWFVIYRFFKFQILHSHHHVAVSYVITKIATTLESLWVYYMITDKSASA